MDEANVFQKYRLSQAVRGFGSVHTLPCNPLQLVATPDDAYTGPLLVVGYDFYQKGRVLTDDMPRTKNFATHVTTAFLPGRGQAPLRFTWGAACFVENFDGKNFIPINPDLAHEAATFDKLDAINFSPFKLLHPSIRRSFKGAINDESWRFFDNCMSIQLTEKQFADAAAAIEKWKKNEQHYQVMGFTNPNCQKFVKRIVREAKIPTPSWWGWSPWPGIDARLLEFQARRNPYDGPWLLQSSLHTKRMAKDASPKRARMESDYDLSPQMVPAG